MPVYVECPLCEGRDITELAPDAVGSRQFQCMRGCGVFADGVPAAASTADQAVRGQPWTTIEPSGQSLPEEGDDCWFVRNGRLMLGVYRTAPAKHFADTSGMRYWLDGLDKLTHWMLVYKPPLPTQGT